MEGSAIPEEGTVERWAWDYVLARTLDEKLSPGALPSRFEAPGIARRIRAPGRPSELRVVAKSPKTRGLLAASGRARALHTFFHHELQAAELMAWAILAFPETPRAFKSGLAKILFDEARHMRLYQREIERLGHAVGEFPVRDWFWERVPTCESAASFVAVMGLGLESANLEHAVAYAAEFRRAGDEESARVQELVAAEEIAHAKFGAAWFARFTGDVDFDAWMRALPPPLTPLLMKGDPLAKEARARAGQPPAFIAALDAWRPAR